MHDGSCIGINYAHRFPKCFRSLHHFVSTIQLLYLYQLRASEGDQGSVNSAGSSRQKEESSGAERIGRYAGESCQLNDLDVDMDEI